MAGKGFLKSFHSSHLFGLCLALFVCFIREKQITSKISPLGNKHKRKTYRWCTRKCLIANLLSWRKKLFLLCTFCWFPWCKDSHHSQFQANKLKSLIPDLGGDGHPWPSPAVPSSLQYTVYVVHMPRRAWNIFYSVSSILEPPIKLMIC